MEYRDIFKNPELDAKWDALKSDIVAYVKNSEFDLGELTVDDLIERNNLQGFWMIYKSDQCPLEIENIVTSFILKHFPHNKTSTI